MSFGIYFGSARRGREAEHPRGLSRVYGAFMQLSWNDGYRALIVGLDILGVRRLDQALEVQLVGGLTTATPRARYLSLVTWALGALYHRLLREDGGGELHWSVERQNEMLTRLEFLVAAATQAGARNGEDGSLNGVVGSDVYRSELDDLAEGGAVSFPPPRRPGVLNAYGSPIQSFGPLEYRDEGPLALTPRGQDLAERMDMPEEVQRLLFEGEQLTPALLDRVRAHFSLNGLQAAKGEHEALLRALDEPVGSAAVARLDRFRATRRWVVEQLATNAADGDGLIDRAYNNLVSEAANDEIARLWGEVALRKRVHFALELLLSAFACSLDKDRGSTIETVVARFAEDLRERPRELLDLIVGDQPLQMAAPWSVFRARVAPRAFIDVPPRTDLRDLRPCAWQLGVALCLLAATEQQTRSARNAGWVKERSGEAAENVFQLLLSSDDRPTVDITVDLLRDEVVHRHLRHTMRKMAQGASNSLRFYPRGDLLVPTGTEKRAGMSLTRLTALLQVMADLGHLEAVQGGFRPTDRGLAWAAEVSS